MGGKGEKAMPLWVTFVGWGFSAVAAIASIVAIRRTMAENRGREEVRLLTTLTSSTTFRDRVVEIVVSSDRIEAKMEGQARSVLLAELPNSETAQELKAAMQDLGRGIREIESIFMRAGLKNVLDGEGNSMAHSPRPDGRDVGRANGTPALAIPAPRPDGRPGDGK